MDEFEKLFRKAAWIGKVGSAEFLFDINKIDNNINVGDGVEVFKKVVKERIESVTAEDGNQISFEILEDSQFFEIVIITLVVIDMDTTREIKQNHSYIDKLTGDIFAERPPRYIRGNVKLPELQMREKLLNEKGYLRHPTFSLIEMLTVFDVNVNCTDAFGESALSLAASFGQLEVIEYLLSNSNPQRAVLNINQTNCYGSTAIMKSCSKIGSVYIAIAKLLIESKCDLNLHNIYGRTALHVSSFIGNLEAVKLLLSNSCSKSMKDKSDHDARFYSLPENCLVSSGGLTTYNPVISSLLN